MQESEFLRLSEEKLAELADFIDENDEKSLFDANYADGILNIEIFDKNMTYVVNKHSASQKIWFSSPVSGANYFSYNEKTKSWLDKNDQELSQILLNELKNIEND